MLHVGVPRPCLTVLQLVIFFLPRLLQGKQKMSEDEMEQLMDALEKMHHTELQKHPERWANLIGSPLPAKYALNLCLSSAYCLPIVCLLSAYVLLTVCLLSAYCAFTCLQCCIQHRPSSRPMFVLVSKQATSASTCNSAVMTV